MNKLFLVSSVATFSLMFRDIYRYSSLKKISHLVKTSIQLDTSYETVTKDLHNKNFLLASSLVSNDNNNYYGNFPLSENFNEEIDYMPLKFKTNKLGEKKIFLSNFQEEKIEIKWGRTCLFFDAPVLKSSIILTEEKFDSENYKNLNIFEKLKIWPIKKHDKIIKVQKGFVKDQRLLVYGKVEVTNNFIAIHPEFLIGSGTVEFEDNLENSMNKLNYKLFDMLILLILISILHFFYKTLIRNK